MSEFRVATRYAKSLADLAKEKGVLAAVHDDMMFFNKVCQENRGLRLLLRNPIVNREIKLNIISRIFGGRVNPLTLSFFEITVKKNREELLEIIALEFHRLYNRLSNVEEGELVLAAPISETLLSQLQQKANLLAGKQVELNVKIDPNLIGGFVLTVGDKQLDESVRSQLNKLRQVFAYNPYVREV
ncbi:MAG: ATP synthase F1 subunit delta [Cytophagales bacterium]|nr:ATP synthase F1 subunit delta [Bernardetiaceae bacterium]MDW8210695.1 ATP synthase F1 subunit delta [Cytophagales bacterium]